MVVVFETSMCKPVLVAEHDDPRVRTFYEQAIDKEYHCLIKEKASLSVITAWDISKVFNATCDKYGGLVIDMVADALCVDPLLRRHVDNAMKALQMFADIVQERTK